VSSQTSTSLMEDSSASSLHYQSTTPPNLSSYHLMITMIANRLLSKATRHLTQQRRLQILPSSFFSTTASTSNIFDKISFIGTGKMSQAMLSPLVTNGAQTPSSITAYDVSDDALAKAEELFPGVRFSLFSLFTHTHLS